MKVICEVSARHVHPATRLVGLTKKRDLSQGGHWAADEKIPKNGMYFTIVMPPRDTEVFEMSLTDWYTHMEGKPQFTGHMCVKLRHFHCDEVLAQELGLKNGQMVAVEKDGIRAGRLYNVEVRIDTWSVPRVHLDTDEANALYITNGDEVELII